MADSGLRVSLDNHSEVSMKQQEIAEQGQIGPGAPDKGVVSVAEMRVEHRRVALGIGTATPRISWTVATERQDWRQQAYEIRAYDAGGVEIGATGRVNSDQSVLVPWPFRPLRSRER